MSQEQQKWVHTKTQSYLLVLLLLSCVFFSSAFGCSIVNLWSKGELKWCLWCWYQTAEETAEERVSITLGSSFATAVEGASRQCRMANIITHNTVTPWVCDPGARMACSEWTWGKVILQTFILESVWIPKRDISTVLHRRTDAVWVCITNWCSCFVFTFGFPSVWARCDSWETLLVWLWFETLREMSLCEQQVHSLFWLGFVLKMKLSPGEPRTGVAESSSKQSFLACGWNWGLI